MIVPAQYTGDQSTSKHSISLSSLTAAKQAYLKAKDKLLNVNEWKKMCGPHSADFQLMDPDGNPVEAKAAIGYLMRIDLPGPSGYDWVSIEAIEDKDSPTGNSSYIAMRVRPTQSPTDKSEETSHFYEDSATSTFVVERIGTRITAIVYGRNESPNVKNNTLIDKLRNLLITLSTILGFQKPQWKSFVVGILK
jgi:hypothetical protein